MIASVIAVVVGVGIILASTWLANFVYAYRTPPEGMTREGALYAHRLGATAGFILAALVAMIIVHTFT